MMPNDYRMDMLLEEYRTCCMTAACAFCKRRVPTRGHHVVPRCKGGRETAPTCHSCEDLTVSKTISKSGVTATPINADCGSPAGDSVDSTARRCPRANSRSFS